ncbi:hypothetical protein [Heyndrickxia acidicola]|uniref:Integral membrane protein n=1 Tax=Heyndrickxia acidicola TaxID=209389 RepID=A0ABU6MD76_9BACI|nr:hypothetical protein [Heyndrickxia acidicola]MED1202617.1 hypothetical protein [Heyndrickxia acidicola]
MFGTIDVFKFLISFFLIFPIATIIHLSGHIFFVTLFGGSEKKMIIGCGNKLFAFWKIEIRKFYFWNGACEFKMLKYDNRFTNMLIYIGGALFNLISMIVVNRLTQIGIFKESVFTSQFIYFSFYVLFFSLFPMSFQNGSPSDGKAAVLAFKKQHDDKITDDIQIKIKDGEASD